VVRIVAIGERAQEGDDIVDLVGIQRLGIGDLTVVWNLSRSDVAKVSGIDSRIACLHDKMTAVAGGANSKRTSRESEGWVYLCIASCEAPET
jgi:hypothetical protein